MANAVTPTYTGRSILFTRLKGSGTEPLNVGWGIGTQTGSANSDVQLFSPGSEARVAGASTLQKTTQLADTYQVIGTITCTAAKSITEAGLFDTTTASPTTTISNSLTTASTVITIGSGTGLPGSGNYYMQLLNEVVLVTAGQGTTTITVARAQLGSAAGTPNTGSVISLGGDGGAGSSLGSQTATVGAAQGGSIFIHGDFAALSLASGDAIAFTVKDQLT